MAGLNRLRKKSLNEGHGFSRATPGPLEMRALAPKVRFFLKVLVELFSITVFQFRWRLQKGEISGRKSQKGVPQRLKPHIAYDVYGTAEAVPFVQRLFPQPVKPRPFQGPQGEFQKT